MKNKNLAENVRHLRKSKGYSQEDLSENSGLSLRTIQRIENGENEPTGETLKRISYALNVKPEELIDWAVIEDNSYLKALNLSSLTFIVFPLLGFLVPLIMWISKKDKLKNVNRIAKNVINFQITWTIILFSGYIMSVLILIIRTESNGIVSVKNFILSYSLNLIFFLIMYILNIILILVSTSRISKNKEVIYFPKISFIS
ncbi:helix-turn-helix domain-containing protein [Aurantibacter sp.]|uniref:helix-turn-helix domain-containing protein n=1 Tax=Aurantibacter sp. TaxID=2807103 RepID=UPI003263F69F